VKPIRIGTRGSQLAIWQAQAVQRLLEDRGSAVEIVTIRTTGDRLHEAPLSEAGGKSLFVKEIEDALLNAAIDLAVHSAKDLPAILPTGLTVSATLPREDPRDALVLRAGAPQAGLEAAVAALGGSPAIGTGSARRIAQVAALLPHARFSNIRGNVDTRLRKLDAGGFDALVLASAGLKRLGFSWRISAALPVTACVPAPGQGIIAIESRVDDSDINGLLANVNDPRSSQALDAERALVAALGGGCQLPLGAVALHDGTDLDMHAVVASVDGRRCIRRQARGRSTQASQLGQRLADELAAAGALEILGQTGPAQQTRQN
jgi:hydroxymethylbilane synthase